MPLAAFMKFSAAHGELTTIALAKEMHAELTLIDDFAARQFAEREGLIVSVARN
jgi:predicted nucleic acid-binding protein